jgi:hypothetical protein
MRASRLQVAVNAQVSALRNSNIISLPEADGEWGECLLTVSQARSGSRWSDDGKSIRPRRELKLRAEGETRTVPIHPDLVPDLFQFSF